MKIVCVLRSGGVYTPEWVYRLKSQVEAQLPGAEFVCYTDMFTSEFTVPLEFQWHGWWSKLEVFWEVSNDPTLYLDLDTVVCGPLGPLVDFRSGLTLVKDFAQPENVNSSVMCWRGDFSFIPELYYKDTNKYNEQFVKGPLIGDQGFIQALMKTLDRPIRRFDEGLVRSWRWDVEKNGVQDCSVIAFHGNPKQKEVAETHHERRWLWPTEPKS